MSTAYETIPPLDGADQAAALQSEKNQIGKVAHNPFLNYLNNASQVLGPVTGEVLTQSGNADGGLVVATAVNATAMNTDNINAITDPYAASYNSMSSPYQGLYAATGYPYSPSTGVATTTSNMTTGGVATTTGGNLSYSMGTTSGAAPGNIQDSIAQMTNNQQQMLALQYQVSMAAVQFGALSNIVKADVDSRMNTIRNMKVA